MKQSRFWLLALLSIPLLVTTTTLAIAEEEPARLSGNVEMGVTGMDTKDNPARVNEYVTNRSEDGLSAAPSLNLEYLSNKLMLGVEVDVKGPRDQSYAVETDFNRVFRLDMDYQVFEHWLDHDNLNHMGATMAGNLNGGQPSVTTDKIFYETGAAAIGGFNPGYNSTVAGERYFNELSNEYIITHRKMESEASITIPNLPSITFHAGTRIEEREGLKQVIGVNKCASCHISASGKDIDERTTDFTLGATGKFGPLTVNYDFLTRDFEEDGATPTHTYPITAAGNATNQLLYMDSDPQEFNRTPDSEKTSHTIKARLDLSGHTSATLTYVNSEVKSGKNDVLDPAYLLMGSDTLKTEYQSVGGKLSTKVGELRLSVRASSYKIDVDGNEIYYPARESSALYNSVSVESNLPFAASDEWVSAEERDVSEFGVDAVYPLTSGTTLRLGYGYENVERAEEELGETETNTFKVSVKSRISKQLSGRISYEYQDIDTPFHSESATGIAVGYDGSVFDPISGLTYLTTADFYNANYPAEPLALHNTDSAVWYWNSVYPSRGLDATQQPDQVNEAKFSTTWTPSTNVAATLFARVRVEDNDAVNYKQSTYAPGASFYYAPTNNLNLTMAYTFNKQETENQMCVGWYHG